MTLKLRSSLALVVLLAWGSAQAAEAPPAGATSCSGCHGAPHPEAIMPPITGRPAAEIVAAMTEFRDGKRPATVMDRIAKGFTDEETRAIAAWLAVIK